MASATVHYIAHKLSMVDFLRLGSINKRHVVLTEIDNMGYSRPEFYAMGNGRILTPLFSNEKDYFGPFDYTKVVGSTEVASLIEEEAKSFGVTADEVGGNLILVPKPGLYSHWALDDLSGEQTGLPEIVVKTVGSKQQNTHGLDILFRATTQHKGEGSDDRATMLLVWARGVNNDLRGEGFEQVRATYDLGFSLFRREGITLDDTF